VFFLYDELTLAAAGDITITETNILPEHLWTPRLVLQGSQVILYDADTCAVVANFSNDPGGITTANGNVTIPDVPAGDYIVSLKYDANTNIAGCSLASCPDPGTTYRFAVTAGGLASGSDSVHYAKKP
jgi:hypothetical protein